MCAWYLSQILVYTVDVGTGRWKKQRKTKLMLTLPCVLRNVYLLKHTWKSKSIFQKNSFKKNYFWYDA